jgi:paired amphipathic helix protein Sin3a
LIEKVFEGDMESQVFEEEVRGMFGIQAYLIFTVHRVVQALFKQVP